VWRDTLSDGYIAVRSYQNEVLELEQKELTDHRFDFDKIVSDNLNVQLEKYNPK
jgi:hypothetical protein